MWIWTQQDSVDPITDASRAIPLTHGLPAAVNSARFIARLRWLYNAPIGQQVFTLYDARLLKGKVPLSNHVTYNPHKPGFIRPSISSNLITPTFNAELAGLVNLRVDFKHPTP